MKDWLRKIDKDMTESGRRLTWTSAIALGTEIAIIFNAVACKEPQAQGRDCDIVNNGETPKLGEARKNEVFDSFNKAHPEFEGREKFAMLITLPICGVPADSIVIPTTDEEKEFINSFEYSFNGNKLTPLDTAIVWTTERKSDGTTTWTRLGGVSYPLEDGSVNTVWYFTPDGFEAGKTEVQFTDQVFAFNSRAVNFSFWPRVEPTMVDWSADITNADASEFETWDGDKAFVLPIAATGGGASKSLFSPAALNTQEETIDESTEAYNAVQEIIARSANYTLINERIELNLGDGGVKIVDGLIVNPDGTVKLTYNGDERYNKQLVGKTFDIVPESITIDDETQAITFKDTDGMFWKFDTKDFIPEINNNLFMAEKLFHKDWEYLTSSEFLTWVNEMEVNNKFEQVSEKAIPINSIQFTPDTSNSFLKIYGVAPIFNLNSKDRSDQTYLNNRELIPYELVSAWKTDFKGVPAYYLLVKWKNSDGTSAFLGHLHFVQGDKEIALAYEVIESGIDANDRIPTGNFYTKDSDVGDGCLAYAKRKIKTTDGIREQFCNWYWDNQDITLPKDMYQDWKNTGILKNSGIIPLSPLGGPRITPD